MNYEKKSCCFKRKACLMRVRMMEIITFKFSIPVFQGQTEWLLDCNVPSNAYIRMCDPASGSLKSQWLSFVVLKQHGTHYWVKKKIAGQCLCWAFFRTWTQIRSYLDSRWLQQPRELCIHLLGTCHSILSLLVEVREYIWKDLIKVLKDPIGYKCPLLLSVLFKAQDRGISNRSSASIPPEASPDPALLWSSSSRQGTGLQEGSELRR